MAEVAAHPQLDGEVLWVADLVGGDDGGAHGRERVPGLLPEEAAAAVGVYLSRRYVHEVHVPEDVLGRVHRVDPGLGGGQHAGGAGAAGVVGVEFEVVPPKVAAVVTKKTDIIIMSMGSGSDCDAQFLFSNDVLGWTEGRTPRHARVYRDFKKEYERLQSERVKAFTEFHQDTLDRNFNDPKITVSIDDKEYDKFLEMAEKI